MAGTTIHRLLTGAENECPGGAQDAQDGAHGVPSANASCDTSGRENAEQLELWQAVPKSDRLPKGFSVSNTGTSFEVKEYNLPDAVGESMPSEVWFNEEAMVLIILMDDNHHLICPIRAVRDGFIGYNVPQAVWNLWQNAKDKMRELGFSCNEERHDIYLEWRAKE